MLGLREGLPVFPHFSTVLYSGPLLTQVPHAPFQTRWEPIYPETYLLPHSPKPSDPQTSSLVTTKVAEGWAAMG